MRSAIRTTAVFVVYIALLPKSYAQENTPAPVTPSPGPWSASAHMLLGNMHGFTTTAGAAYRKGRHKFELAIAVGPFAKSYSPRLLLPAATYRCFMFKQKNHFNPYLSAQFNGGAYERTLNYTAIELNPAVPYEGFMIPATQRQKHLFLSTMVGVGFECPLLQHFYLDANLALGPSYHKEETWQRYSSSNITPPVPYRLNEGIKLSSQLTAGIGYKF